MGASDAVSILRLHSMRQAEVKSERAAPSGLLRGLKIATSS